MRISLLVLVVALWVMVGCERPSPVTQVQAEAFADAMVMHQGEDWGRSRQARLLPSPDARGRIWWQIIYRPGPEGQHRWIAVNRDSGWARLGRGDPEIKYQHGLDNANPADLPPQRWILLIEEVEADAYAPELQKAWEEAVEHARRRQQAALAHLPAAYGIRRSSHSYQLLWGWDNGAGSRISDEDRRALSRLHPESRWIPWDEQPLQPKGAP